ncbi:MAG: hypothetical protein WC505_06690 [Patescibacteria group bacterium]
MQKLVYRGHFYRLAEGEDVTAAEEIDWHEHVNSIMRAIRAKLGAPGEENRGAVKLDEASLKMVAPTGEPELGYEIHGDIITELPVDVDLYGGPPYRFEAIIPPAKEVAEKQKSNENVFSSILIKGGDRE